nr:ABC transporter ATP-binding protein [Anaerolineae bacterium]
MQSALPRPADQPAATTQKPSPLMRSVRYLGLHRRSVLIAYGALVIATLAQLGVPRLVQMMINHVIDGFAARNTLNNPALLLLSGQSAADQQATIDLAATLLVQSAVLIVGFALMRGVFAFIQTYMAESTSQGIAFDLRNQIFAKIQRLSFSYYDSHQTGQLMVRATSDVENVRLFIAQGLIQAFGALLLTVATLIILFTTNWQLALSVVPILPLAVILFGIFGKLSQPLFGELQRRLSALNTVLQENIAGIKVVKAFVRQNEEQARFNDASLHYLQQQLKLGRTFAVLFPLIFTIAQIGQVVILFF